MEPWSGLGVGVDVGVGTKVKAGPPHVWPQAPGCCISCGQPSQDDPYVGPAKLWVKVGCPGGLTASGGGCTEAGLIGFTCTIHGLTKSLPDKATVQWEMSIDCRA